MTQVFTFDAIATVHSCYRQKFGVPRQPGLVLVESSLEMHPPYDKPDAFRGLNDFSHLWLVFVFHQTAQQGWNPTVRPPRLGGNERVGVFASRSTFRPNPVGLSVVEFKGMRQQDGKLFLDVIGADLIDGTPILDIKPYIPYADAIVDAKGGYAQQSPVAKLRVEFSEQSRQQLSQLMARYPDLENIITATLQLDPRPAYAEDDKKDYAMRLFDVDVRWRVSEACALVFQIQKTDK